MKKIRSQVLVATVCILLGFMITHQLKVVMKQNKELDEKKNVAQITIDIEQLKKQKEGLEENVNELQTQVKNYEDAASNNDEMSKELVKKLEDTRMLTGSVDVQGEGVVIYITPQNQLFGNGGEGPTILDTDLVKIVNELNAADAEAISINDIRLTGRTGIRSASNYITISGERISPYKRITIKAIGNKVKLKKTLEFPGVIDGFDSIGVKVTYNEENNIKINKNNESKKFEYAKPIKDNK